jgi:hypothetical protein
MLPTKLRFIWPNGFRGEDFLEINQSEIRIECSFCPVQLTNMATQAILVSEWLIFYQVYSSIDQLQFYH